MRRATIDSFFSRTLYQEELEKAAAKRESQRAKKTREQEEAKKNSELAKDLGLDTAIQLIGPFYISQSVYDRLSYSFESVVFISLFTKPYGRETIISGAISHSSILSFILTNLLFAAPEVALIAGIIRFCYVFLKDIINGEPWKVALKHAAKEAIKTAIKFFFVYLIWVLAVALATSLTIMSGPLLPLGIILVGVLTSLGFTLVSFLVDKVPDLIHSLRTNSKEKTLALCIAKFHEIKACLIPGFMEGWTWVLLDNFVNVSGHISGLIGKVIDLASIGIIVSLAFFVGAIIHCSLSRWFGSRKAPKEIKAELSAANTKKPTSQEIQIQNNKTVEIKKEMHEKVINIINKRDKSHDETLKDLLKYVKDNKVHDPHLMSTIVQYIQYIIIFRALEHLTENSIYAVQINPTIALTAQEKLWLGLTTNASKNQLNKLNNLTQEIQSNNIQQMPRIITGKAARMKNEITKERIKSFKKLQKFGVFAPKEQEPSFSSTPTIIAATSA